MIVTGDSVEMVPGPPDTTLHPYPGRSCGSRTWTLAPPLVDELWHLPGEGRSPVAHEHRTAGVFLGFPLPLGPFRTWALGSGLARAELPVAGARTLHRVGTLWLWLHSAACQQPHGEASILGVLAGQLPGQVLQACCPVERTCWVSPPPAA